MLQKNNIGFLLTPGFNPADIIGTDAVLGIHGKNKVYYISHSKDFIYGKSNFGIKPNATFNDCPQLDVLVVGAIESSTLENKNVLDFIFEKAKNAKYILGISSGVLALHKAGIISDQTVTADQKSLEKLKSTSLTLVHQRQCVVDGKIVTAGPSTGGIEAAFTIMSKLRGKWFTKFIEFNLEYNALIQFPVKKGTILKQPELQQSLKVGVYVPDELYLPDVIGAMDVFSCIPNSEILLISKNKQPSRSIAGLGPEMMPNTSFEDCPPLDVLIMGATHPRYVSDPEVLGFILKQNKSTRAMISVCAGTFILGATGLLKGKKAATNYHQIKDLKRIGAHYTGKEVEVDGKYLSAGPAIGSYEVGIKAVEKTLGKEWAQYIEHEMLEFNPNPVFGTNPNNVNRSILTITKSASIIFRSIYRPYIRKGLKSLPIIKANSKSYIPDFLSF